MTIPTQLDYQLAGKLRAMGAKWSIDDESVLHLAVRSGESVRQTVNLIMPFHPQSAVISLSKTGAEIQLG